MCIIIAKYKNKKTIPTIEQLKTCFENNPDGAGFMYINNDKRVVIDKGYMNQNTFIQHYKDLCKKYNNFKNKALVIHCRIGTSSGNIPENTHPYIITNKEKLLHKEYITSDLGIAHNGIISEYNPTEKNPTINDTQNFIINYLYPIYSNYPNFYKNKYIRNGIQLITNSKFALLDNNEDLYIIGDFVNDKGLLFSNTTYKTYYYYSNYTNKYKKLYDDYYDYLDYDFEKDYKKEKETKTDYNNYIEYNEDDLIPVDDSYYIYDSIKDDCVSASYYDFDLYYNPYTFELFKYNYAKDDYELLQYNIIVYDKDFKEVV